MFFRFSFGPRADAGGLLLSGHRLGGRRLERTHRATSESIRCGPLGKQRARNVGPDEMLAPPNCALKDATGTVAMKKARLVPALKLRAPSGDELGTLLRREQIGVE
jgi:hypothetical protein